MQEATLGTEAIAYIRSRLRAPASKVLSGLVLESVSLERGTVRALVPAGMSDDQTREFKHGKGISLTKTTTWIVGLISQYLQHGKGRICIFENALAVPRDGHLQHKKSCVIACGDDVYHVLAPSGRFQ